MLIRIPKGWEIPEREATPESIYLDRYSRIADVRTATPIGGRLSRRGFLTAASATTALGLAGAFASSAVANLTNPAAGPYRKPLTSTPNHEYKTDRPVSSETIVAGYNNYYEFTEEKDRVWQLAENFQARPWHIEIKGHVAKPVRIEVDDLIKQFPLEERVYRHRCVERWVVIVPWVGFPMKKFVEWCQPTSKANYVRMVSFLRPDQAQGQREATWYPWPYFEGLSMEEATNELALMVVGMYARTLTNQNGNPIRLHTPWKYGYKSIKAITRFEFVEKQPPTFWHTAVPNEYDFVSNVNPAKPHPRWSQAMDQLVETREVVPTKPFNGYEKYVAYMYK